MLNRLWPWPLSLTDLLYLFTADAAPKAAAVEVAKIEEAAAPPPEPAVQDTASAADAAPTADAAAPAVEAPAGVAEDAGAAVAPAPGEAKAGE